jgi:hypothetical protein
VLKKRSAELPSPIQMCDALSRNVPKLPAGVEILLANCLAHGRRQFVEVAENFPQPLANVAAAVLPSSYSEGSRHPVLPAFRSSIARPTNASVLRFKRHLTMTPARLEVRMDSLLPFLQRIHTPYNMPV